MTFDAGGIQIKPDKYMLDMKCDMAGAAGVLGVAMYLDSLPELPLNVVFGLGIVENMTGAAAFILRTMEKLLKFIILMQKGDLYWLM